MGWLCGDASGTGLAGRMDVHTRHDATKIMHFCWTHNLTDKVHKMNAYGEMHVTKDCTAASTSFGPILRFPPF